MSVAEILKSRISTRAFLDRPVNAAMVHAILDAARWAPSGNNVQPWKVIVVAGAEREALSSLAQATLAANRAGEEGAYPIHVKNLAEPYRGRKFKVGEDMYAALGIAREDKMARMIWGANNFAFFNAPVGLFFVIDKAMGHAQWAHLGMFIQSVALVAEEVGLATCMQEAWAMVRETLHKHFELPENEMIYCGMALGYADRTAPVNMWRAERAAVEEFAIFRGF
jgi:nitroreductase